MADTLESICARCSNLSSPRLDFIPESLNRERRIIVRDLRELVSAARMNHEKTAVILAGSVFESLLYVFLSGRDPSRFAANRVWENSRPSSENTFAISPPSPIL